MATPRPHAGVCALVCSSSHTPLRIDVPWGCHAKGSPRSLILWVPFACHVVCMNSTELVLYVSK
jgi:hypothetical protein